MYFRLLNLKFISPSHTNLFFKTRWVYINEAQQLGIKAIFYYNDVYTNSFIIKNVET